MASKNTTLIQRLKEQVNQSAGMDDKLEQDRKKAWDYYFQRRRKDEIPGRSTVVSGDVSAMTEAVMSQMDEAFSSDNICEFRAFSSSDEDQARLESDIVCDQVMSENNGSWELLSAIKNCLLLRNAVAKVWVAESRFTEVNELTNVTLEAYAEIAQQRDTAQVKVESYSPETGDMVVHTTHIKRKLSLQAVPLSNFIYPIDWHSLDLQKCPFVGERHVDTRSDMIDLGFPAEKINKLKPYTTNLKISAMAQSPGGHQQFLKGVDKSQDHIEWFELYVMTSNGRRRYAVSFNDNELLQDVPVTMVPYAAGAIFINPNRFTGISLFDKLKQAQDKGTGLDRALLDNVNTVNKNRIAYLDGVANEDDIGDGRTNGSIRVKNGLVQDVRQALMAFTIPDLSAGLLQNIEHNKQTRAEMGGAALTLATGNLQLSERAGSQGIDRAYSVMEQLSAHMTRNIAKTLIRSVFLLAHETLRTAGVGLLTIQREGRWIETDPSKWQRRENVFIKIGMSPGERSRRVSMFEKMLENQVALAREGMDEILVNADGFYATMVDWARAGDIKNPERYYIDPRSEQAVKALQGKQQAAQQASDMKDQLVAQAIQLEQIRSAIVKYQTDVETQFKYYDANLKAQIEEAKIVGDATTKLLNGSSKPESKQPEKGSEVESER